MSGAYYDALTQKLENIERSFELHGFIMTKKQDVIAEETETVVVHETPVLNPDAKAEAHYARYAEVINPKTNVPLPSWIQLDELYKNAWRAVAS